MAFFSEGVDLLASISLDRRVYVWRIIQGPVTELHQKITGLKVMAVEINEESDSNNLRICWHCRKEEVLVVGIGRIILKINSEKLMFRNLWSNANQFDEVTRMSPGVHFVGQHDGEVTTLSMCKRKNSILVSAANDGTVKLWKESNVHPIAQFKPHNGWAVSSAIFLCSPNHQEEHTILVTGANHILKIWISASAEGLLRPEDGNLWHCKQTLELKSSASSSESVLFDQVLGISRGSLLLMANSKKKTIYAIHIEYGQTPTETRMDYITEFSIAMPILSFTGMCNFLSATGERSVQLHCILEETINQYLLDLSRCSPPLTENVLDLSCLPASPQPYDGTVQQLKHIYKTMNQLISMLKRMDVKVSTMEQKISMMEQRTIAQEASESTLETSRVTSWNTSIETMFQKFDTTLQKRLAEQHFECTREPMNQLISMLKRMDTKISTMEQKISIMEQTTIAQEASESTLETSMVDSWKTSIETMLKKFDATMQKRLAKQHFESTHEPLALLVGDIIKSALSRTTPVLPSDGDTSSFTESQQKNQISKDLEVKLIGLLRGEDYEKAFAEALGAADPSTKRSNIWWLCSKVEINRILKMENIPLSKGVLLDLLNQTQQRVMLMKDVLAAATKQVGPDDMTIQISKILDEVYEIIKIIEWYCRSI